MLDLVAALPGADLPPPLQGTRYLTGWELDPWLVTGVVLVAALYAAGVLRLRRRGVRWPVGRSAGFGLGLATVLVATCSFLGAYDDTLFWVHMAQHMVLAMASPVLLALGAPVTLALRVLPRGGRRALLRVLHSRVAAVLSFPAVSWVLFVANPFVLYFSPLYRATLEHPLLHEALHVHFLVTGCLFFWPLLGIDPVPGRLPYPFRLLTIFAALPTHAFLGIAVMSRTDLIAGSWYRGLGRTWGPTLLEDQHIGGGLLWASGDLVGLLLLATLFVQWVRSDERDAARTDRALDREQAGTGRSTDTALADYNAHLAALARRSG